MCPPPPPPPNHLKVAPHYLTLKRSLIASRDPGKTEMLVGAIHRNIETCV